MQESAAIFSLEVGVVWTVADREKCERRAHAQRYSGREQNQQAPRETKESKCSFSGGQKCWGA